VMMDRRVKLYASWLAAGGRSDGSKRDKSTTRSTLSARLRFGYYIRGV
jgi:hypothetical protein